MARKQADPTARRAREAARRAAAAQRIGPQPLRTPRPRQPKFLFDLKPPGAFYTDWDFPVGTDTGVMGRVIDDFGADSVEAATMRILLHFRRIYGPNIPLGAIGQLELLLDETDLLTRLSPAEGVTADDARKSVHSLHAHGLILIADDGSLWRTIPPGTPNSAPGGRWSFVEQQVQAPAERTDATV
ncbi:hypothetical protein N7925_03745 [Streptomyces sp. CA-278952]|uniref:hypothetical protein n=1 Tax=unclassified Streptomyces TaxID=2593676 RepID=UPI002242B237|nr:MULTISPECIES: hypothetical protein [unclassified Streptomyces]UZI27337.1 hypothetical protein OH133_03955 [Streptomyces sp. VB1]WDG27508.1 hypothetical protein N7925_03745 [Streptomyces sp. CA-278952]